MGGPKASVMEMLTDGKSNGHANENGIKLNGSNILHKKLHVFIILLKIATGNHAPIVAIAADLNSNSLTDNEVVDMEIDGKKIIF